MTEEQEKRKRYNLEYREKNRAEMNRKAREYYHAHKAEIREYQKNKAKDQVIRMSKPKKEWTTADKIRHYRAIRKDVIARLGGKCVVCGTTRKLEIDHINPKKKKFEVSARICTMDEKKLKKELDKCQLLCHKHHMEKSIRERGDKPAKGTHGTVSSYRYCRCPKCTEAHSAACAAWKLKKKEEKLRRKNGQDSAA